MIRVEGGPRAGELVDPRHAERTIGRPGWFGYVLADEWGGVPASITYNPAIELNIAAAVRWMDGFDARAKVTQRKRGRRILGRLRLARLRLWQAFVGLE